MRHTLPKRQFRVAIGLVFETRRLDALTPYCVASIQFDYTIPKYKVLVDQICFSYGE